ncbi:hypothetical protein TNCV_1797841 [Trichonephila clavipes]|nr:hypothetical protein TNCV_1797841 [Trichonephila clavipes]
MALSVEQFLTSKNTTVMKHSPYLPDLAIPVLKEYIYVLKQLLKGIAVNWKDCYRVGIVWCEGSLNLSEMILSRPSKSLLFLIGNKIVSHSIPSDTVPRMENTTFAMPNIIDSHDMGLRTVLQSRRPKENAYSMTKKKAYSKRLSW